MQVTIRQLAEALYFASRDKQGAGLIKVIDNALTFMRDHGLLSKKDQLFEALEDIRRRDEGNILVRVYSRTVVAKSRLKEIGEYVQRQTKLSPEIDEILDPSFQGGVKIVFGDTEVDGSVAKQLQALRHHLKS